MAATLERPLGAYPPLEDETVHYVCCEDDNRALCGKDVSGEWWVPGEYAVTCLRCAEVNSLHPFCPFGKRCPE